MERALLNKYNCLFIVEEVWVQTITRKIFRLVSLVGGLLRLFLSFANGSILKGVGLCVVLWSLAFVAQASCKFNSKDPFKQMRTFKYNGVSALNIPSDAVDGVVYRESFFSSYSNVVLECDPLERSGIRVNSALGMQPAAGAVFPIKGTGLSWRIDFIGYTYFKSISDPGSDWNIGPGPSGSDFWFGNEYELALIKDGDVKDGAVIPAGILGTWETLSGFAIAQFKLLNQINVVAASCNTPNVDVQMGGDYRLDEFEKPGDASRQVNFDISLNACPKGIKTVKYMLKANTEVVSGEKGIVSLSKGSTAKGIELQIKSPSGNPLALDTYHQFAEYDTQGGNMKIPLSASYLRSSKGKLEAGSANADVTFVMSYL